MTLSDKLELFDKYCESMVMVTVDSDILPSCLAAVGKGIFRQFITDQGQDALPGFDIDDRMMFLDSSTVGCIVEATFPSATHSFAGNETQSCR